MLKLATKRFQDLLYAKYLTEYNTLNLQTRESKILWLNQKPTMKDLFYISECDNKALRCQTIEEMFELIYNSERVFFDLNYELEKEKPNFTFNFRLWDDRLLDHLEFRGFVYHHKLCALTQYDNRQFFRDIYDSKELIQKSIQEFYESKVKPRIDIPNSPFLEGSYVIDFAIVFESENKIDVVLIEINPFQVSTVASLFNWKDDIDVLTGKKEFEFRIVESKIEPEYIHFSHELNELRNQVKERIVNENKSFFERWVTWRDDAKVI